jgi:PAS domain S-box-containing protein
MNLNVAISKGKSQARHFLVALLAPAFVAGVMLLTWPLFEGSPVALFLFAIIFTAWYGGFWPGLLSVLTSGLLADYFFLAPYFSLGPANRIDVFRLVVMTIVGVCCSALSGLRQKATHRVESILSGVADAHSLFDRNWRFLYVNDAAVRAKGRPREEILGRTLWEVCPDIAGTELDRQYRRAMDKGVPASLDFYYQATDTWWANRFFPAPEGLAVFATNITERKRTEEKLREYEKVVEGLEEMIVVVDREYRYLIANRAFLKQRDLKKERVVGRLITDVLGREFFENVIKDNLDRCFQGEIVKFETRYTYPRLGERDLYVSYLPIEGSAGIDRVACVLADRTEGRRAEKAHGEAERKYRDIFENAGEGIFQSTPEGQYIAANPTLARMHGFDSPEDLIQARNDITNQIYVDPRKRVEFRRLLEQHGTVRGFEHQIYRKDGSRIWISVNARAVRDDQGKVMYYEGTSQDITKRKRAEARSAAFATLARKLSGVRSQLDAGRIIAKTAADLFGWDSCNLNLYDADRDTVHPMLNIDMIDGQQVDVTALVSSRPPTARSRRIIDHGPELVLREEPVTFDGEAIPFGDTSRPSASLMSVPIRHAAKIIGLLSIQSYNLHAYDQAALADLEALADHCGAALNRIRAEESLHESEERFRQLAENLEDVIWITDRKMAEVLYINLAYERIFGRSRESVYQKLESFLEAVHPDDRESVQRRLDQERNGDHSPFEYRIRRPDGTVRWIHRRTFPIRNDEGEVHRVAGIGQDITERKRAQEGLRESEERYRDLVENSREFICTHDLNGLILTANRAAADMLGYDLRDYCRKKSFRDLLAPEVRDQFDDYLGRIRRDGVANGLTLVQTSSGERRVWEYHSTLRTEGVDTPIVRGMARDITEERRAQNALRESEERYRELFENAKDALYVHDLSGRYTSFNRAAEQLSGFSREEILGKHFSNFVAPAHLKHVRQNLCKKLDDEGVTTYEIDLVTKDRRRVPVEVSSRLIYENGEPAGVQGVARDISDRKRAQEALRTYSRRLIEAQEAERQVIARELHDEIGQVLTAVRINLQSVQRSAQAGEQSPIADSLTIVDEALDKVRELSLNLRPSVLDNLGLSPALRWYVDRYARRSGIVADLQSSLEDGRRLSVELETHCFRIVQEALTNIARHARATHVLVRLSCSNGNLDLKIMDNGVGFDVEAVLKDSPSASALGLRGMKERAVASMGSLTIDSAPMRGTEVRASFPLNERS